MKKILFVDDDEMVRDVMEMAIQKIGFSPLICENPEEAIRNIAKADLILTDFDMKNEINGSDLARIAKEENPSLPVIIISGDPWEVPEDTLADCIIAKPVNLSHLNMMIIKYIRRQRY